MVLYSVALGTFSLQPIDQLLYIIISQIYQLPKLAKKKWTTVMSFYI